MKNEEILEFVDEELSKVFRLMRLDENKDKLCNSAQLVDLIRSRMLLMDTPIRIDGSTTIHEPKEPWQQ